MTSPEHLFAFLNTICPMSPALESHLREIIGYRFAPQKAFVLQVGEVSREMIFIQKGLLRCYYLNGTQEVSAWFMKENDVVVSINSFYRQQASRECIQALEDTELFFISYGELQQLYALYPEFNIIGRILTTEYLIRWSQELENIRMLTVQQRWDRFWDMYPDLVQRVPLKYIASFLDTDPATLSRIRSKF